MPVIPKPEAPKPPPDIIDVSKRYDVYCREGDQEMVYRNVLFKRTKKLFQKEEFIELEEADGQKVFVAKSSVLKFREHVSPAGSGPAQPQA